MEHVRKLMGLGLGEATYAYRWSAHRWVKHMAVDNANLYLLLGLGWLFLCVFGDLGEREYRTDILSDDCATACGYANGLMWEPIDVEVCR